MTKKSKSLGGKGGDAVKMKSVMDNLEKKGRGKKHDHDEKRSPTPQPPKEKSVISAARQRWNISTKVWDSTFANLKIQLNTVHRSGRRLKKPSGKRTYWVKKVDKEGKPEKLTYAVRRGIPGNMDAALWEPERPDVLRYEHGYPVSHSILGTIEDYLAKVDDKNDNDAEIDSIMFRTYNRLPDIKTKTFEFRNHSPLPDIQHSSSEFQTYSPLPDIKPKTSEIYPFEMEYLHRFKPNQGKALQYWNQEVIERQKVSAKLALKTKRSKDDLIMGNNPYRVARGQERVFDDLESAWQSDSRITKSNGFWKQREQLGDNLRGIHMTRTKTEEGINPESEVIYRPGSGHRLQYDTSILDLKVESILPSASRQMPSVAYNLPTPAIYSIPEIAINRMNEPAVEIGQHVLSWSERDCEVDVELGIITSPGETKIGKLVVKNIGSTVIRYELFKIPKPECLNILNRPVARDCIFLDDSEAIILPKDYQNISAIFHSHRAAVCSEKWLIETTPQLARKITLTVWGIAKDNKQLGDNGKIIEEEIKARSLHHFMENILDDIIEKICCVLLPVRVDGFPLQLEKWFIKTPVGNELFTSVNPGFTYHSGTVSNIIEISAISLPNITYNPFSLPLNDIRLSMFNLPDEVSFQNDVVTRNDVANTLMTYVNKLSHDVQIPMATRKYDICKKLLLDLCDDICDTASRIKKIHGITLDMDFKIDIPKLEILAPPPAPPVVTHPKGHSKAPPKSPSREAKGKKKHPHKEHAPHRPPSTTGSIRLGQIAKGINTAKKSQYKNRARPIMYLKYIQKFNISTSLLVRDCIDKCLYYLSDLPEFDKLRM